MANQIRSLEVSAHVLNACDVGPIARSLLKAEQQKARLPELRGTVMIAFPSLDADPRPNYLIPEVRSFIQKLYVEVPHFLYYLNPEPALGAIGMHVMSLLPLTDLNIQGHSAAPKSYGLLAQLMIEHLRPAALFATRIGDDASTLVSSYRSCVPDADWPMVRTAALM